MEFPVVRSAKGSACKRQIYFTNLLNEEIGFILRITRKKETKARLNYFMDIDDSISLIAAMFNFLDIFSRRKNCVVQYILQDSITVWWIKFVKRNYNLSVLFYWYDRFFFDQICIFFLLLQRRNSKSIHTTNIYIYHCIY